MPDHQRKSPQKSAANIVYIKMRQLINQVSYRQRLALVRILALKRPRYAKALGYLRQYILAQCPLNLLHIRCGKIHIGDNINALNAGEEGNSQTGDEFVEVLAELSPSEERRVLAGEFARAWQKRVREPAGLEKFSVRSRGGGPPGEDLQIRLTGGGSPDALKQASLELQNEILKVQGLSQPRDDMAFGKKQAIFSLTPLGHSLGLTAQEIAGQLRDAFSGRFVQTFYEGVDEIELRVMLSSGDTLRDFSSFQVRLPDGGYAALADIAEVNNRRGFDVLQRYNARLGVNVIADVDFAATDVQQVQRTLRENILPKITERFGVSWSFEGKNADERQTVADMKLGLLVAAILIYTILAAVFSSWTFPLVTYFDGIAVDHAIVVGENAQPTD